MHFIKKYRIGNFKSLRVQAILMFFLSIQIVPNTLFAQNANMNPTTASQCETFKKQLSENPRVQVGQLQVPLAYSQTKQNSQNQINVMYWTRKPLQSQTSEFPPLLLIHGGVGGNSSGFFTWKPIMENYPGMIISLDLRGEGCSNFFPYNQNYLSFRDVTLEATVRDLELLREKIIPGKQWRIFGQSRGSAIVHRYLEMFPDSLESVHAHGLAMQNKNGYENYSLNRSLFNARTGQVFYEKYPSAGQVIDEIRDWLTHDQQCFTLNYAVGEMEASKRPKVCGAKVVHAFSGRLSAMSGWKAFAESLVAVKNSETQKINTEEAKKLLQSALDSSLYTRFMGYIFGTNSLEFHAPDIAVLEKAMAHPFLQTAKLSEGHFILQVAYPIYEQLHGSFLKANHIPYDFDKVRKSIENRKNTSQPLDVFVYMSSWDPVAAPEAFDDEKEELKDSAQFILIPESAHDGWKTHPQVVERLMLK